MANTDGTFIFVATYPDEAAAQEDYQVVKDLHARGLVGLVRRRRRDQGRQGQGA